LGAKERRLAFQAQRGAPSVRGNIAAKLTVNLASRSTAETFACESARRSERGRSGHASAARFFRSITA
jgi:hypothetical protein